MINKKKKILIINNINLLVISEISQTLDIRRVKRHLAYRKKYTFKYLFNIYTYLFRFK